MVDQPALPGPEAPTNFPQVEPTGAHELFPTNNIRFVISETSKLIERVDNLKATVEKQDAAADRIADRTEDAIKAAVERIVSDMKERFENAAKPVNDLKTEMKEVRNELREIDKKVAFVRGAMWVVGILFTIALVIVGAMARAALG